MTGGLVDFHCHLDLYPDHAAAVTECEQAGIRTLAVTTTPRAWKRNRELTSPTRCVRAALGLHPQLAASRADELPLWEEQVTETRFIGEVGLDAGPQFFKTLEIQKRVFEQVLRTCARHGGKILSVHSVRAVTAVLDLIETLLPPTRGTIVLHWFTGTKAEARRAIDLGCFFSINSQMLLKERNRELVGMLPRERLLTETDGPFTEIEHRPMRPVDVYTAVEALAYARHADPHAIAEAVLGNLRVLLGDDWDT